MRHALEWLAMAAMLTVSINAAWGQAANVLEITSPQTAGVSGFRAHWDTPFVLTEDAAQMVVDAKVKDRGGVAKWSEGKGALAFDALNRSLLVRFPDAAEKIAERLKAGAVIRKAEVVLPFRDEELWPMGAVDYVGPEGYTYRMNWGVDEIYRAVRPRWHAVAWALRRPWMADGANGPTFNAAANGAIYWTRYGAADLKSDRHPARLGPTEVSHQSPEGRLDVTSLLTDADRGATIAARLRAFADCGLIIQKEETYDAMYYTGPYEWATATGGRAVLIKTPRLVVTFGEGKTDDASLASMPAPADVVKLAEAAKKDRTGNAPTAVMPDAQQLSAFAAKGAEKPAWMPDWQWERTRQLIAAEDVEIGKQPFWFQFVAPYLIDRLSKSHWEKNVKVIDKPADPAAVYNLWVDGIVGRQPRGWNGFETAREMSQWYLYKEMLPGPAQDAIKRYWTAWLMPDRPTAATELHRRNFNYVDGPLVHPMADDARVGGPLAKNPDPARGRFDTYYAQKGDWRGNKSFFRSGFCYAISTQNFNTTSSAGALLAGAMIGSDLAMADGRHGVETFPLRLYCWSDGSGQEHIDHYYFSITLAGNKAVADFAQTPFDRLLGQSLLTKNVEELIGAYHPGLRSFIAGSSRTSLDLALGMQDGIQHVMHTLSKSGAVKDWGTKTLPGNISTWGHDVPPHQVAQQTLAGPWAPQWVVPMVDEKPLPFEAKHTGWGGVRRVCYLGENYGLASNAIHPGRIQTIAQWRREPKQVEHMTQLGTLDMRYSINQSHFANQGQGSIFQPGSHSILQHKKKLIAINSPKAFPGGFIGGGNRDDVASMQSTIGFFNFQSPAPTWEIYVDGAKIEKLPFTCKQGQRITIKDGVTFIGVIPLPATDLGRDAEVVLEEGTMQKADHYKSEFKAALVINSYNLKRDKPILRSDTKTWEAAARAYGGFALEIADAKDFADFSAFQKHLATTTLDVNFDGASNTAKVKYVSGSDTLEAASVTFEPAQAPAGTQPAEPRETGNANLSVVLVNEKSPWLPEGIERDTPYAQQGLTRVEKNGAILEADTGRRIFLLTEPKAGVYCGWNPLPDLTTFKLTVPGGITVKADGKVSLMRVTVTPSENKVQIDTGFKPGQENEDNVAGNVFISGCKTQPIIELNGVRTSGGILVKDGAPLYDVPIK